MKAKNRRNSFSLVKNYAGMMVEMVNEVKDVFKEFFAAKFRSPNSQRSWLRNTLF